jgi:hypothetical protein
MEILETLVFILFFMIVISLWSIVSQFKENESDEN